MYCTVYTVHCIEHWHVLYCVHFTLYSVQGSVLHINTGMYCSVFTVQGSVLHINTSMYCSVFTVQGSVLLISIDHWHVL